MAMESPVHPPMMKMESNPRKSVSQYDLHKAARDGQLQSASILVSSYGLSLNARNEKDQTPVSIAIACQSEEFVENLMALGDTNVDALVEHGKTLVHIAAFHGKTKVIWFLVNSYGANVNETSSKGSTALHFAAARGHVDAMRILVEFGVDVDAQNIDGSTALHIAVDNDQMEAARILREELNANEAIKREAMP